MNEMMIFTNAEFGKIRTTIMDGEPWFVGKDVTEVLGYANASKALSDHVDGEDKLNNETLSSLGQRGGWLINESGLYSLILSSKLPTAKSFKRWVTSEVLPAIRKHGMYVVQDLIDNPDLAIEAFTALKAEREKRIALEIKSAAQEALIEEMTPKATYHDIVLNCPDVVTVNTIAKDYGKSAIWLNQWLHEQRIQYKQGKVWHLYQKYSDKGYAKSRTLCFGRDEKHCRSHMYWTQEGRFFIYNLLKEHGILPLIEREDTA